MRKIILMTSMSLDGYIEGPDRQIDWHFVDDEVHRHMNDEVRAMGGFLEGRVTYELMEEFWPTADADPANAGPMADFAGIWRDTPKYVYSRTLQRVGDNATIVRDVVPEQVAALKAAPGGDLGLGGTGWPPRSWPTTWWTRTGSTYTRYGSAAAPRCSRNWTADRCRCAWRAHTSSATAWCNCATPARKSPAWPEGPPEGPPRGHRRTRSRSGGPGQPAAASSPLRVLCRWALGPFRPVISTVLPRWA